MHVPGMRRGHVAFHNESVIFGGDCLFAGSIGRTDHRVRRIARRSMRRSRRMVALGDELTVYPGHGRATTIGRERRDESVRPRHCATGARSSDEGSGAGSPCAPLAGWPAPVAAIVLAAWIGATLYFSVVVTRAAFAVLPTRTMAGALVGRDAADAVRHRNVGGRIWWARRCCRLAGAARTASLAGGIAIVVAHGARAVRDPRADRSPAASQCRPSIDSLPSSDPSRRAFGQLHAMSVGALGLAMLIGLVVVIVLVHALSAAAHD